MLLHFVSESITHAHTLVHTHGDIHMHKHIHTQTEHNNCIIYSVKHTHNTLNIIMRNISTLYTLYKTHEV